MISRIPPLNFHFQISITADDSKDQDMESELRRTLETNFLRTIAPQEDINAPLPGCQAEVTKEDISTLKCSLPSDVLQYVTDILDLPTSYEESDDYDTSQTESVSSVSSFSSLKINLEKPPGAEVTEPSALRVSPYNACIEFFNECEVDKGKMLQHIREQIQATLVFGRQNQYVCTELSPEFEEQSKLDHTMNKSVESLIGRVAKKNVDNKKELNPIEDDAQVSNNDSVKSLGKEKFKGEKYSISICPQEISDWVKARQLSKAMEQKYMDTEEDLAKTLKEIIVEPGEYEIPDQVFKLKEIENAFDELLNDTLGTELFNRPCSEGTSHSEASNFGSTISPGIKQCMSDWMITNIPCSNRHARNMVQNDMNTIQDMTPMNENENHDKQDLPSMDEHEI